jgi:DNA-binding phage protein
MSVSSTMPDGTKSTRPGFPVSGRLSLDLTWTLRYRSVWPTELLTTPDGLGAWLRASGLPAPVPPTARDLTRFRALREAIYRSASAVIDDHRLDASDRELINRCAATPTPAPEFAHEYDAARRRIDQIDRLVQALNERREVLGMTKAELARRADLAPEAVRRLFSADSPNPTISTLTALADTLGLELVPRQRSAS